jgi:hypothetical protein
MNMRPINAQQGSYRPSDCLSVLRLPGRVDGRQAASLLGFQPHDIPVLVAAKLLQPLGKPAANAPKYFAACVLEELRCNPDWLDRASRAVSRHWQVKNEKKAKVIGVELDEESRAVVANN